MEPDKSKRFVKIIAGLKRKTRDGDLEWEESNNPFETEGGYDASLARSSYQLRIDADTKKVRLKIFDESGEPVVALVGATLEAPDALAGLYQVVKEQEAHLMVQKLDRILEEIEADEPPF
jgi:hypothetical protein